MFCVKQVKEIKKRLEGYNSGIVGEYSKEKKREDDRISSNTGDNKMNNMDSNSGYDAIIYDTIYIKRRK